VGWPSRPGGAGVASFQVSKTYQALQNLKQKYIIDDGDADMITLKELLSSLTSNPAAPASTGAISPQAAAAAVNNVRLAGSGGSAFGTDAFRRDIQRFEDDMSMGIGAGFVKMAHDTEWNIEHIQNKNAATGLLRGLILVALAYVGIGSVIKYYTLNVSGIEMIPHISFWMEYPKLVADGVTYTQIIVAGFTGSSYSSGGQMSPGLDGGVRGGHGAFESM
jgi:hypothetical protein